jgi:hypothetical protein
MTRMTSNSLLISFNCRQFLVLIWTCTNVCNDKLSDTQWVIYNNHAIVIYCSVLTFWIDKTQTYILVCKDHFQSYLGSHMYITDLIFIRFKVEFRFFNSGFYRYDSFFIVYSILPIADFRFFVVLLKWGLILSKHHATTRSQSTIWSPHFLTFQML